MSYALKAWLAVLGMVLSIGCGGSKHSAGEAKPAMRSAAASPPVASEMAPASGVELAAPRAMESPKADAGSRRAAPAVKRTSAAGIRTEAEVARAPSPRATGSREPRPIPPDTPPSSRPRPASPAPADDTPAPAAREPVPSEGRGIQSGTLTAGSVDDHERLDDYRRYLSDVMQQDPGEPLPRLDLGRRVVIRVENRQGLPIADARVVVRPAPGCRSGGQSGEPDAAVGTPLLEVTTASDGQAVFLSGLDGAGDRREVSVSVSAPGASQPVTKVMDLAQPVCRIQLPEVEQRHVARLDLALVIDTTGSMSDELEYLKIEIDSIARSIHQMFPNVDQRYALIVYRDQGDQYVTRTYDFTGSLEGFRSTLSQQFAAGGGDYPEAVHLALAEAGRLSWRRDGTARVLFLVGDAPPHEPFCRQTVEAVAALRRQTVRVYPVGASGVARQAEFMFRAAAFLTQAQYLFLTDHSGVGNPHAPPQVPQYAVERLDRLMLRMIASELAGRKLAATEIIAIEGGRSPYDPAPIILPEQQTSYPPLTLAPVRARAPERASLTSLLPRWLVPGWMSRWTILAALLLVGMLAQQYVTRRSAA